MSDDTNRPDSTSPVSGADTTPVDGQALESDRPKPVKFNPLSGLSGRRLKWSDIKTGREGLPTPDLSTASNTASPAGAPVGPVVPSIPSVPKLGAVARRALANAPLPHIIRAGNTHLAIVGHTETSSGMIWSGERKVTASGRWITEYEFEGRRYALANPRRPDQDSQADSLITAVDRDERDTGGRKVAYSDKFFETHDPNRE